jgi:hypothetical protein
LRRAGRLRLEVAGEGGVELLDGRRVRAWARDEPPQGELALDAPPAAVSGPVPGELADEVLCVAAWHDSRAGRLTLLHCGAGLAEPIPPLPSFAPREPVLVKSARG